MQGLCEYRQWRIGLAALYALDDVALLTLVSKRCCAGEGFHGASEIQQRLREDLVLARVALRAPPRFLAGGPTAGVGPATCMRHADGHATDPRVTPWLPSAATVPAAERG